MTPAQAFPPSGSEIAIIWVAILGTMGLVGWAVWYRHRHPRPEAPATSVPLSTDAPETPPQESAAPPWERPYPTLFRRYIATVIDGLLAFAVIVIVGLLPGEGAAIGRTKFLAFVVFGFWAEPMLTSHWCTPGQGLTGIRVRSNDDPEEHIGLGSAVLRLLVKSLLGWISFFTLPFTHRQRALHDIVANSVMIQVRGYTTPPTSSGDRSPASAS